MTPHVSFWFGVSIGFFVGSLTTPLLILLTGEWMARRARKKTGLELP